jgi:hypothetical protein
MPRSSKRAAKLPAPSRRTTLGHFDSRRFAKGAMQRANDVADFGPRQGIEYVLALTSGLDQPVSAQAGELLRNRRLTQAEHILDLAH